jgi:hypothetical protein
MRKLKELYPKELLFLDGVYIDRADGSARFWCV